MFAVMFTAMKTGYIYIFDIPNCVFVDIDSHVCFFPFQVCFHSRFVVKMFSKRNQDLSSCD